MIPIAAISDLRHSVIKYLDLVFEIVLHSHNISLLLRQFYVDLFEDIQLSVSLKYGFLDLLDLVVAFDVVLLQVVYVLSVLEQPVHDWVHQLLQQLAHLRFDVEPEEIERWILNCQA